MCDLFLVPERTCVFGTKQSGQINKSVFVENPFKTRYHLYCMDVKDTYSSDVTDSIRYLVPTRYDTTCLILRYTRPSQHKTARRPRGSKNVMPPTYSSTT